MTTHSIACSDADSALVSIWPSHVTGLSSHPPEASMHDHLRGRKHQMALDKAAEVARSIYVKGVPQDLTREEDLPDLFGQFGQVKHSWVHPDKVSWSRR